MPVLIISRSVAVAALRSIKQSVPSVKEQSCGKIESLRWCVSCFPLCAQLWAVSSFHSRCFWVRFHFETSSLFTCLRIFCRCCPVDLLRSYLLLKKNSEVLFKEKCNPFNRPRSPQSVFNTSSACIVDGPLSQIILLLGEDFLETRSIGLRLWPTYVSSSSLLCWCLLIDRNARYVRAPSRNVSCSVNVNWTFQSIIAWIFPFGLAESEHYLKLDLIA